jgi:hypothetical protein
LQPPIEIAVGGCHDLAQEHARLGLTDALKRASLQDAQELDLQFGAELTDLVQEHGAFGAAQLEPPLVILERAGERAAPVSEQLGFDDALG